MIRKNRPACQAGMFNGIGGKFEENETIVECTLREIEEETGLNSINGDDLKYVGYYHSDDWKVYITTTIYDKLHEAKQLTDEMLFIIDIDDFKYVLPSALTAIFASKQKHIDDKMGELVVNYYG